MTVQKSPSWAHDGTDENSPPRDNAELAEFMGFLASRYAGKVQAYEVWNEPNLPAAWPSGPNPAEYAWMLRTVAPSIRAADPSAKVVFAGLFGNDYEYLEQRLRGDAGHRRLLRCDGDPRRTSTPRSPRRPCGSTMTGRIAVGAFSAYREVRATMEAHGDTKPIWFTEFGWSTTTLPRPRA